MVKFFCLIIFLWFLSVSVYSQTWFMEERGDMCGYVDSLGEIKIPFEYPVAYNEIFTDAIVFVLILEEGRGGVIKAIDRNNRKLFTVFTHTYGPDDVLEGLFRIQDDSTGYIGFADMNGRVIIPPRFFYVGPFGEGLAAFNTGGHIEPIDEEHTTVVGGKWGYINKEGKEVFPAIFDNAWSFYEGEANVRIGKYVFNISISKNEKINKLLWQN
ncbi:MAG: WG repeat-containing protein [Candidatus Symbiothrix sp.]|jgi:hypothetical protein|nr:WG repeat-containing protein [Candidatus Symbiothrix sp.]